MRIPETVLGAWLLGTAMATVTVIVAEIVLQALGVLSGELSSMVAGLLIIALTVTYSVLLWRRQRRSHHPGIAPDSVCDCHGAASGR